jgi:signal transduction histidine kinase/AraC-like DNA-binding protein
VAFIQGPAGHVISGDRYNGYVDALSVYDIFLDPDLVTTPGAFNVSTGVKGIQQLLDERKLRPGVDFDAIVTSTDLIAVGALDELRKRDIRVPEETAVVGFNDRIEGRFALPSLTTVRLPFYKQGYKAVEQLLALLAGEQVPDQVSFPAKLRVRQSCGCLPPAVTRAAAGISRTTPRIEESETFATALAARRDAVIAEMIEEAEASADIMHPGWAESLLDVFVAEIAGAEKEGAFLRKLDLLLTEILSTAGRMRYLQDVVSTLRRHALSCFGETETEMLFRAQDIFEQARVLIGEGVLHNRGRQLVDGLTRTRTLHRVGRELTSAFNVEELSDVLVQGLPGLSIESCYLSLYENPQEPTDRARLLLAFDERGRADLEMDDRVFPAQQLIPPELLKRRSDQSYRFVLEPLCFREEQLGFVLFGIGSADGSIYETLRDQISSSLKGALLFKEARKARAAAEQAQAAAEKADSLKTRLLANVSHELRTPLNVIIGCARAAIDSSTSGDQALPDALRDDLAHIHHSAEHQLRVINDLLDLSRAEIGELDLYPEVLDPRPLLEEVFDSMAGADSRSSVAWRLQLPDRLPTIQADPMRLRQILLNLLSNAGKFVEKGQVLLGAEVTPPNLHLWVQDTGPGISDKLQRHIFEPFVTARRTNRQYEGVGLGLSITRRLVLLHRGSMELESQPGQGSTFHVYLPLPTLDVRTSTPLAATQPVLLLISSHDRPPTEIVEFSRRQELEIYRLQASDDLDMVVRRRQPAALAWDMIDASPSDWALVRRLRNHPRLSQAPFMLYGQENGTGAALSVGMTSFVAKQTKGDGLMDAINSVCPSEGPGPILIVDDDPQVLAHYRQIVTKGCPAYSVRTAADGVAAVSLMAEETPSLVILDLMMPEMDGFDVLDWMREGAQTRQVPVVVLSSRLLSLDDVKRLEKHALVTLQSKGVLSTDEVSVALNRALFGIDTLPQHTSALVKRAVVYFHQNYRHAFSRLQMAGAIGVSEDYLSRVFRQEMNISPWEYLNRYRILKAKELLRSTNDAVKKIALQVGFANPSYFSRMFRSVTGISPSAYRQHPE